MVPLLPQSSSVSVKSFFLAFYGDETMGEATRGAHVCIARIHITQLKDDHNMVTILSSIHSPGQSCDTFKTACGKIILFIQSTPVIVNPVIVNFRL